MRPLGSTTSSAAAAAKVQLWKSPTPYLFGGLALMLILIVVALIILSCSYRKRSSGDDGEKKPAMAAMNRVLEREPKIVVIMAGDDMPTYLATPATSLPSSTDQLDQNSKSSA